MIASAPALSSQYDPASTEAKWQENWESKGVFTADPNHGGEPYCVVIPPPNVTGSLHMGHAFESALIDVLVRYHRMLGCNTLWLPGTDHASIAVHSILEKQLQAEGKTRDEIGRDAFLERATKWKAESGGKIVNQQRRLGVSVDWSRERFTMDEGLSKAVREAFVSMYDEGLIYRGNYMVNWCPASQSAVSDQEVEKQEVDGHLWHFRYPLADGSGAVEVATTRPETMLGDTAVAVNPNDERYRELIGKTLKLPIMDREIPVIADEHVDPEFGTGCVKVTPAHDRNDFAMGQRHDLPLINIMHKDGRLNENAGPFEGQDRFEARKNVIKRLEEDGCLVKIEEYRHSVPYSDRGKVPVEPLISTQWFVKTGPMAADTLKFLNEQQSPNFVPDRWTKVYRDWLENLRDWCISRQLWWGHQIPAWYAVSETEGEIRENTPFIVAHDESEAWNKAKEQFGDQVQLSQDPDVLDTWFSSGLWPFSTMGWPEETADLSTYYPTSTLVTGFDIIFFWVARMTLMSGHFTQQMPFKDVYIHGLVRDEKGQKMSKSKNNGIDPLVLIDKYGTDALRYTLIREVAGAGQDIRLDYDRKTDESSSVEASRNFANKLWNASRFVLINLENQTPAQLGYPALKDLELADRWILSKFHRLVAQTRQQIDAYGLGEASKSLYEFIWGDFCDWYIELVKPRLREKGTGSHRVAQQTLAFVLEGTLKLLHPFMPHITEEIWQTLTQAEAEQYLACQLYPEIATTHLDIEVAPPAAAFEPTTTSLVTHSSSGLATPSGAGEEDWRVVAERILEIPEQIATFIGKHRRGMITLLLFGSGLVGVEVASSVLTTVNHLPLAKPLFQLVGLFAIVQFAYQKLLWKENRKETIQTVNQWRKKVAPPPVIIDTPALPVAEESESVESAAQSSTKEIMQFTDDATEEQFELLIGIIRTIRNLRAEANIKPSLPIKVILQSESDRERQALTTGQAYIKDVGRVESLSITPVLEGELAQTIVGVEGTVQVLIPLSGVVDVGALKAKIEKGLKKAEGEVKSFSGRLKNAKFVDQAPAEVVQGARDALAEAEKQVEILRDRLIRL
ncbi:valine--tRNA ligase [Acaryochloris thomasi]|nr:valine--tRNA ligase [Acaryochloris thomasi]